MSKVIEIKQQKVLIDSDVAKLYGIETKRINEAVKNNPEKFPREYVFELTIEEKAEVVENFDHLQTLKFSPNLPKVFSEKGLYMLATILKSPIATETTIQIIEAYAKIREINHSIVNIVNEKNSQKQESLVDHVGGLIGELIMPNNEELETIAIETEARLKFFTMLEISKKVIKKPKQQLQ